MTRIRTLRRWTLPFLGMLALSDTIAGQTQGRSLQADVRGEFVPGVAQDYTVDAQAGDLIFGTIDLRGTPGNLTISSLAGSTVRDLTIEASESTPVGFVAPTSGTYRIRITAAGTGAGSYTLRTEKQTPGARMAGVDVTPSVRFESARVSQLAREVGVGQTGAVERFWAEAKASGGPIVEPLPGSEQDVLVTFLWRETYETHNVLLLWPAAQILARDYYMSRLPTTNIWFKTLRVHRSSRFSYGFSPNDRAEDRAFTRQSDPLNQRPVGIEQGRTYSILELPGAPDESWYRRTPSSRGTVTAHRFKSALLKDERELSIYTPPGYTAARGPYPLVVLFGGNLYLAAGGGAASNTLDNLIADQRIRPPIVCFVSQQGGGLFRPHADAMATELLPWLRSSYAISADPKDVVVGGWSGAGLSAAYAALQHPQSFGNVLSQSGAFRQGRPGSEPNPLARMYIEAAKVPVRFYLDVGLYEPVPFAAFPVDEMGLDESNTAGNRHFRDVLQAKGYDVIYRETGGAHDWIHWRATLAEGLIALLAP